MGHAKRYEALLLVLTKEEVEKYRREIVSEPADACGDFPNGEDRPDPGLCTRWVTSNKISAEQAKAVYLDRGHTLQEIKDAMNLPISVQAISMIRTGRNWRHVTTRLDPIGIKRRLTKEEVLQIFYSEGSNVQIAGQFNVSKHTVRAIKCRFIHKEITKRPCRD